MHRMCVPRSLAGFRMRIHLTRAMEQLRAYFAGELRMFDLPLAPEGTPFQLRVWRQLQEIPYGETISYGQLARMIGNPNASRAVGLANGRNPIPIVIPCHRVIGSSGKLVGYGGGLADQGEAAQTGAGCVNGGRTCSSLWHTDLTRWFGRGRRLYSDRQ